MMERIKSAWNAFMGRDPTRVEYRYGGSSIRPDKNRRRIQNERSVINSLFNQIAADASSIDVRHVRVDEQGVYKETIDDSLNQLLTVSANIDQTGRAFIQDAVHSILDEGCVALVPIGATANPAVTDSYVVENARVARIVEWYPEWVRVEVYNEETGRKEEMMYNKRYTPIIENPFYSIMNEPNSTLQRLIRTLNQLDQINEKTSSGKLDLIIKLPYMIKSKARLEQAEERRRNIDDQLNGSKHGIAYIDGTEQVIQLNRPLENNLWTMAKELKTDLFGQMGISESIFNNTADENTMTLYYSRIIERILTAVVEEISRKWLSKTARSQGQTIRYFRDPFKLISVANMAEASDKFTRNEIMSSNEIRSKIGMAPSSDPKADELRNSNLNHPDEGTGGK